MEINKGALSVKRARRATRTDPEELRAFLAAPHAAAAPLARWLNTSPRFAAFAGEYRDKIRKKLRTAADADGLRDVLCELETAYQLLDEPRLTLEYEASPQRQTRTPDFSLTYRSRTLCHVEAARLRGPTTPGMERLHEVICGKLGQMLPGAMNVLVIATATALPQAAECERALQQLQVRAERGDAQVLERYHFEKRADFFRFYTRLSAVVLRNSGDAAAPVPAVLCLNKPARHLLPVPLARALRTVFTPAATAP